jgi:hypothetical protein
MIKLEISKIYMEMKKVSNKKQDTSKLCLALMIIQMRAV